VPLEDRLVVGGPMLPDPSDPAATFIVKYDGFPYIGTFQLDGNTILFWGADAAEDPVMRIAYVVLTEEEAANLASYLARSSTGEYRYENQPLLMNRRVVVGVSERDSFSVAQVLVIERSGPKVFDEIDVLVPVES
jgi:hypothetical protein